MITGTVAKGKIKAQQTVLKFQQNSTAGVHPEGYYYLDEVGRSTEKPRNTEESRPLQTPPDAAS